MNYLELQDAKKGMTGKDLAAAITAVVVDNTGTLSGPVDIKQSETHKTHYTVTITRTIKHKELLSFGFTLAGWYGASVMEVVHSAKDKYLGEYVELTLSVSDHHSLGILKIRVNVIRKR